ncbi:MAG: tRNA (adenosine(37)-N6)-threonylcarbamoyltransferase complex ATPase subunit type 1 TsaE [Abditibacteriales bacterium]|nr:tRNA (adenosine(37)-N6)-threonylcarbamoyltransferase complex ATPase subunit type 1 TsaE [Abditibacteriales bacterium]MDW8365182.1 tRNA (adenosine(37)-N6)-threonylcarbamoyltransferase complex ATPase subunit type 1 TsaE [Abditibacteriales bacterium]
MSVKILRGQLTSAEQTHTLGKRLGERLQAGDVVCLYGALGAGKTTLTQGIAAGLGVATWVNSPTFIFVTEHEGRVPLYHVDAYRLPVNDRDAARDIGLEELIGGAGVCVIEWAERVALLLPPERLDVRLEHTAEGRAATVEGFGERWVRLIEELSVSSGEQHTAQGG